MLNGSLLLDTASASYRGAKLDITGGGGQQASNAYNIFDVSQPAVLKSVVVYPGTAGTVVIDLRNSSDSLIQRITRNVSAGDVGVPTRLFIDLPLPVGNGLRLAQGAGSVSMFRNSGGVAYPYVIPGVLSIYSSSAGTTFYYFFYDWEVQVAGTGSIDAASAVNVVTGTLGGNGTAYGPVTVQAAGRLAPGSSAGILTTGPVTFTTGSSFDVEVNGVTPGTEHDRLVVTGTVNIAAGAKLNVTLSPTVVLTSGTELVIIANDDTDPISGTFQTPGGQPLPEHAVLLLGGQKFVVSYQGGDGNDLVLLATTDTPILGLAAANSSPTALGSLTAFTATISAGPNVTYTWSFGDGSALATGSTVSHTYASLGLYTATVTATNAVSTVVATTVARIEAPILGLTATNSSPAITGAPVALTATVSSGTNVTYTWSFGDGSAPATGQNVTHAYANPGVYTAIVTATNPLGTVSASTRVTVTDSPILGLDIVVSPNPVAGIPAVLTATVTGGGGITYTWSINGSVVGSSNPLPYTFPTPGTYAVTVTATNSFGSATKTIEVAVAERRYGVAIPGARK